MDWTLGDHAGANSSAGRAWITAHMGCEGVKAQRFFCLGFLPRGTNLSCYAVTAPQLKESDTWYSAMETCSQAGKGKFSDCESGVNREGKGDLVPLVLGSLELPVVKGLHSQQ